MISAADGRRAFTCQCIGGRVALLLGRACVAQWHYESTGQALAGQRGTAGLLSARSRAPGIGGSLILSGDLSCGGSGGNGLPSAHSLTSSTMSSSSLHASSSPSSSSSSLATDNGGTTGHTLRGTFCLGALISL